MIISEKYNNEETLPGVATTELGLVAIDDKWVSVGHGNSKSELLTGNLANDNIYIGQDGKAISRAVNGVVSIANGEFVFNETKFKEQLQTSISTTDNVLDASSLQFVDTVGYSEMTIVGGSSSDIVTKLKNLSTRISDREIFYDLNIPVGFYDFTLSDPNTSMFDWAVIHCTGATKRSIKLKGKKQDIKVSAVSFSATAFDDINQDVTVSATLIENTVTGISQGQYITIQNIHLARALAFSKTRNVTNCAIGFLNGTHKITNVSGNTVTFVLNRKIGNTTQQWFTTNGDASRFFGVSGITVTLTLDSNVVSASVIQTVFRCDVTEYKHFIHSSDSNTELTIENVAFENTNSAPDTDLGFCITVTNGSKLRLSGRVSVDNFFRGVTINAGSTVCGPEDSTFFAKNCIGSGGSCVFAGESSEWFGPSVIGTISGAGIIAFNGSSVLCNYVNFSLLDFAGIWARDDSTVIARYRTQVQWSGSAEALSSLIPSGFYFIKLNGVLSDASNVICDYSYFVGNSVGIQAINFGVVSSRISVIRSSRKRAVDSSNSTIDLSGLNNDLYTCISDNGITTENDEAGVFIKGTRLNASNVYIGYTCRSNNLLATNGSSIEFSGGESAYACRSIPTNDPYIVTTNFSKSGIKLENGSRLYGATVKSTHDPYIINAVSGSSFMTDSLVYTAPSTKVTISEQQNTVMYAAQNSNITISTISGIENLTDSVTNGNFKSIAYSNSSIAIIFSGTYELNDDPNRGIEKAGGVIVFTWNGGGDLYL